MCVASRVACETQSSILSCRIFSETPARDMHSYGGSPLHMPTKFACAPPRPAAPPAPRPLPPLEPVPPRPPLAYRARFGGGSRPGTCSASREAPASVEPRRASHTAHLLVPASLSSVHAPHVHCACNAATAAAVAAAAATACASTPAKPPAPACTHSGTAEAVAEAVAGAATGAGAGAVAGAGAGAVAGAATGAGAGAAANIRRSAPRSSLSGSKPSAVIETSVMPSRA